MSRRNTSAACLLGVLFASSHAVAQPADSVRFTLAEGGAVVVPVTIDGAGPFRFLLDTGSSRSSTYRSPTAGC